MAEEGVIRLLLRDESLYPLCDGLAAEEFSSPLLGKIYGALLSCQGEGRCPGINMLAASLTAEEMDHLSGILQKPEDKSRSRQALADYIGIIKDACQARRGDSQVDPLLAAQEKYKTKKGYGGKQHE